MGDVDEGNAQLLLETFQFHLHLLPEFEIQRAQRLIQQKYAGPEHRSAGNGHTLPLATAELAGHTLLVAFQAHQRQRFRQTLLLLGFFNALELEPIGDILGHIHVGEEGIALKDGVHRPLFRRQMGHILAFQPYATLGCFLQSGDDAQGGGLAAAGRAQQRQKFTCFHRQVQVVEHHAGAVILAQVFHLQNGCITHGFPPVAGLLSTAGRDIAVRWAIARD